MIRIAALHLVDPPRGRRRPNLNREWIELTNQGLSSIDIYGYVFASSLGEKAVLEPSGRSSIIVPPAKSVVVFTGRPDLAQDPPGCYVEIESDRFFLCRTRPIWAEERDAAFLYPSMSVYLADTTAYLDAFYFTRHCQAKQIMGV